MTPLEETFVVRSIVPNTSQAYLLRVSSEGLTQRFTILAWRVEWFRSARAEQWGKRNFRVTDETYVAMPIVYEDAGGVNGCLDIVVDRGVYTDVFGAEFYNEVDAIRSCVSILTKASE